ncbi:hypothetical protein K0M31_003787 [Melipona bicolor]|uniref:Uncharacterized protein n=1 Tax=Melipona bicolor TaxID=60889 RepID=A0AA40KNR4_9HYME|nr:hypothetical protein K0M31_003787 [Melipona bicolor]
MWDIFDRLDLESNTPVRAEKFCTPDSERREVTFFIFAERRKETQVLHYALFLAESEGSFLRNGGTLQRTSNEDKHFSMYNEFEYIDMDDYFRLLFSHIALFSFNVHEWTYIYHR